MDTERRLQQHEGFRAPQHVVFALARSATGHRPIARTQIALGNDNEVYCVDTDDGAVVVRINRDGEVGHPSNDGRWSSAYRLACPCLACSP